MADKVTIELDESFLKKFFGLTDQLLPDMGDITLPVLKRQVLSIEEEIRSLKETLQMDTKKPIAKANKVKELVDSKKRASADDESVKGRVLIIDDLGVITYQLSTMLRRTGFECVTSNDIVGAIDLFKKNHYDFVLMDLFIPTQREGFILLDELRKISADKPYKTVIGIMSASNKKEYKLACSQKGSDFYLEKTDCWQDDVCKLIENYES
ncbi:response regulator [bacterium]|nr:response regulator [bacterium]